jgi:hypothetical protein
MDECLRTIAHIVLASRNLARVVLATSRVWISSHTLSFTLPEMIDTEIKMYYFLKWYSFLNNMDTAPNHDKSQQSYCLALTSCEIMIAQDSYKWAISVIKNSHLPRESYHKVLTPAEHDLISIFPKLSDLSSHPMEVAINNPTIFEKYGQHPHTRSDKSI